MGAGLCVYVPASAADPFAGPAAGDVRASSWFGVWVIGAGVGELVRRHGEGFRPGVGDHGTWRDAVVLVDPEVSEAVVVLVLDSGYAGGDFRGLHRAGADRSDVQPL